MTQEQISEILGISVSAYKKIESGENNVSSSCLRQLHDEMGISADFVLFGKTPSVDKTWEEILNCSETDKLFLLLKLLAYFTQVKKGTFPLKEEQSDFDRRILRIINEMQHHEED